MVTTIQVNERTLAMLRKLKEEIRAKSYEEAINKVIIERAKKQSLAGFLGKKYGHMPRKKILKDLRDKNGRF